MNTGLNTLFAFITALLFVATPSLAMADGHGEQIEKYSTVFKDSPSYEAIKRELAFQYDRHRHNMKKEPGKDWSLAVAIEPNGRLASGFGKGTRSNKNAIKWCKRDADMRSTKAKCRVMAINDAFQRPYKP